MMKMNLKQLTYEDVKKIYNNHMVIDFPIQELKSIKIIQKLIKEKTYICYGLYDNKELLAYSFLVISKLYLFIDYYAVCSKYRNSGIGSEFLNILKECFKSYNGIIVEVEKIECALNEDEKIIRKRRIDFYRRNGMRMTSICSTLFNVNYSIMCLCNIDTEDSIIYQELKNIYKRIFRIKFYSQYVKIDCKEINKT